MGVAARLPSADPRGTVGAVYFQAADRIVTRLVAGRPNVYAASPLDRANTKRDDAAWVAAALAGPQALFVPVWRARNLVRGAADGAPEAVFISGLAAAALRSQAIADDRPWALLGLLGEQAVFAVDLSAAADPAPLLPDGSGEFVDLRSIGWGLVRPEAAMLGHARGLLHWRAGHRFCGVCGGPCTPRSGGQTLLCSACATQHFPRTDPAVIMLVTRGDHALLGRSRRFTQANLYSTLAGFVEPGESLEEAVRREVREEAGVQVGDVRYHSSQPWPFPGSIMLGFTGEALTDSITIDPEEMSDVRWFSRDQIGNPEPHGLMLPRVDSIARRLIEDWIGAA